MQISVFAVSLANARTFPHTPRRPAKPLMGIRIGNLKSSVCTARPRPPPSAPLPQFRLLLSQSIGFDCNRVQTSHAHTMPERGVCADLKSRSHSHAREYKFRQARTLARAHASSMRNIRTSSGSCSDTLFTRETAIHIYMYKHILVYMTTL